MEKYFSNVQEMVSAIRSDIGENTGNEFYFRGQVYPWRLCPSLFRSDNIQKSMEETASFIDWLKRNHYICEENVDDNMLMAVAQHYGYKTDFIDFTTDLDVAAYFSTDFESFDSLPPYAEGCLWCVSKKEIPIMQYLFWNEVKSGTITDENVISKFRENPNSPFFSYDFPGLSRLKNQSGLFLWDYRGLYTAKYFGGPDYRFQHTCPGAYSTDKINRAFIYPEPNALEREIERYVYERTVRNTMASEEYKQFLKKGKVYHLVSGSDRFSDYEHLLELNQWKDDQWKNVNRSHFPNENVYKRENQYIGEDDVRDVTVKKCMDWVEKFEEAYQKKVLLEFSCENKVIEKVINEVIKTMYLYPYHNRQSAECLFYTIRYAVISLADFEKRAPHLKVEELQRILNDIRIVKVAEQVYEATVIDIEMQDCMNVGTRCFVPFEFLCDMKKEYKRNQVERTREYLEQKQMNIPTSISSLFLMQLCQNPRRLFDFEDICELFVKYVLPYQFAFRPKNARIYLPSFLTRIGLA